MFEAQGGSVRTKSVWAGIAVALPITLVALGQTADAPQLKEGLWFLHTVTTTNPGNKRTDEAVTLCRNHAYDAYANAMAMMQKDCTVNREFHGDTMRLEGSCKVGKSTVVSKGTMKMTGDTVSHAETHTTYTPALHGVLESTLVQEQTWLSSCPEGMRPGERRPLDQTVMPMKQP